jgi:hypothetical protein
MKYANKNLLEVEKWSQLLQEISEDHVYLDPHHKTLKTIIDTFNEQSHEINIRSKPLEHTFDTNLSMMQLNHKQQKIYSIFENPQGSHILTCTLRSGQTFFVKYIFQTLGINVLLSTTMGTTTLCLCSTTTIVHTTFCILV